ncbi:MAG: hypothetical protein ACRETL_04500, partial [Gammaproteobacteria bacterium]
MTNTWVDDTASPPAQRVTSPTYPMPVSLVGGGGGATSPAKAEDAAAASGDLGIPAMAVQTASPADAASAGD